MKKTDAFQVQGDAIRQWDTGVVMPADFTGHCMVYYRDGESRIFRTWVDSSGERNWLADSKMEMRG